ncbi:MAG: protein kinase [Propionibacteriales bacterium]|nr:protein kinase [Propionibacteriales bacterium]
MTEIPMREPGVLGDRYELQDVIGRGGMAEVYRARDRVLDREVAVKLMRDLSSTETDRARFTDEARMLARLNHHGLVTVLDAATTHDRPYLVMELVRGPSLAECCDGRALDPDRVAAIGAQLADTLGYAHSCGIVHRDLKPGNVLLGDGDQALLTDFGIARLMSEAARHTATGVTIGTAAYLAPEQVRGEDVTPAADVYSLGLVLLEALTGERAYQGSPTEAAVARLTAPPAIPASVPVAWHGLLRSMTALAPDDRPSTAQVAAEVRDLSPGMDPATAAAALRTESGTTRPLTVPEAPQAGGAPAASLVRRWRWPAGAAAAILVAVFVAIALIGDGGQTRTEIPSDVPPRLEQPLRDLHDAVEGRE